MDACICSASWGRCLLLLEGTGSWPWRNLLKEFKLKLMGINRAVDNFKAYEEWARMVEQRTNGRVKFELTSLPELGFGGLETIRHSEDGCGGHCRTYGGYVAGELPMIEILEFPGCSWTLRPPRRPILAWKPHVAKFLDEKPTPSCWPWRCTRSRPSLARNRSASCKTLRLGRPGCTASPGVAHLGWPGR